MYRRASEGRKVRQRGSVRMVAVLLVVVASCEPGDFMSPEGLENLINQVDPGGTGGSDQPGANPGDKGGSGNPSPPPPGPSPQRRGEVTQQRSMEANYPDGTSLPVTSTTITYNNWPDFAQDVRDIDRELSEKYEKRALAGEHTWGPNNPKHGYFDKETGKQMGAVYTALDLDNRKYTITVDEVDD